MPSKRSTCPRRRRCRPASSCSRKYSSSWPSTRPPAPVGRPFDCSRMSSIGSSMMTPTLSRYCCAIRGWATRHNPSGVLRSLRIAIIALERIAAGGDEIDDLVEILARADGDRARPKSLRHRARSASNGAAQAMPSTCCASTSSPPSRQRFAVEFARQHRIARRFAFEHFEAVRRHQQRARRFVEPVIGAADALHEPRRAFRRADADHAVDRAPVDAEIERRGADNRAQIARAPSPLRPCAAAAGASEP